MDFSTKNIILFDLDGTITDSSEGIINSFKYTLKVYGIDSYDDKALHRFLGPPLYESFMEILGSGRLEAEEAVEVYREYYSAKGIYENKLYEGIEDLLKNLAERGKKVILATSKAEVYAIRILEHFEVSCYFHIIAGSELDGSRIKKDEVIRYALDKAEVTDLGSAVMIGDRKHDILGAKTIGMSSIGVLYGYGSYDELKDAGADLIIDTVRDLHQALV